MLGSTFTPTKAPTFSMSFAVGLSVGLRTLIATPARARAHSAFARNRCTGLPRPIATAPAASRPPAEIRVPPTPTTSRPPTGRQPRATRWPPERARWATRLAATGAHAPVPELGSLEYDDRQQLRCGYVRPVGDGGRRPDVTPRWKGSRLLRCSRARTFSDWRWWAEPNHLGRRHVGHLLHGRLGLDRVGLGDRV